MSVWKKLDRWDCRFDIKILFGDSISWCQTFKFVDKEWEPIDLNRYAIYMRIRSKDWLVKATYWFPANPDSELPFLPSDIDIWIATEWSNDRSNWCITFPLFQNIEIFSWDVNIPNTNGLLSWWISAWECCCYEIYARNTWAVTSWNDNWERIISCYWEICLIDTTNCKSCKF